MIIAISIGVLLCGWMIYAAKCVAESSHDIGKFNSASYRDDLRYRKTKADLRYPMASNRSAVNSHAGKAASAVPVGQLTRVLK